MSERDNSLEGDAKPGSQESADELRHDDSLVNTARDIEEAAAENLSLLQTAVEGFSETEETSNETSHSSDDENQTNPKADRNGFSLGRYRIKELLGKGAFGKVYRADDPQLDRTVAIKVLTQSQGTIDRFLREARSAANLRHPNIIPLYDYGELDGKPTIVYQLIDGQTLTSHIEKNRQLKLSDAVLIIRKIARGLDYAHEQGIIHRDVKPDNVLLDKKGEPHIADFGCAKRFSDQDVLQTMEGKTIGTPVYMSPIQASGNSHKADRRADVWSLGVILYEMIAGERPFQGSYAQVVNSIINDDPKPLRRIVPKTPVDIETICSKALRRDLGERFQTAGEFADELERYEKGEPILSRRISLVDRTWRWAKRNPAVASLVGAVFTTLILGIGLSTFFGLTAQKSNAARIQAALDNLQNAKSIELEGILASEAKLAGEKTSPMLEQVRQLRSEAELTPTERLRLEIASLRLENGASERSSFFDENQIGKTIGAIEDCDGYELVSFINGLRESEKQLIAAELQKRISQFATESNNDSIENSFKLQCALVQLDPYAETSTSMSDLAGSLTSLGEVEVQPWLPVVAPIQKKLEPELLRIFQNNADSDDENHEIAAAIFSVYVRENSLDEQFAIELLKKSNPRQVAHLIRGIKASGGHLGLSQKIRNELGSSRYTVNHNEKDNLIALANACEKANLVIALLNLSNKESDWGFLQGESDNTFITEVVEEAALAATPWSFFWEKIVRSLNGDSNPNVTAVAVLSLGAYSEGQLSSSMRKTLSKKLLEVFKSHPNCRVHSSVKWLLSSWGFDQEVSKAEKTLVSEWPQTGFGWHVDSFGNTFAVFDVGNFQMRYPKDVEEEHNWRMWPKSGKRHRFGVCISEFTFGQYDEFVEAIRNSEVAMNAGKFLNSFEESKEDASKMETPELLAGNRIRQMWAVAYCDWLTKRRPELSPVSQVGFEELVSKETKPPKRGEDLFDLTKTGYRLPTSAEFDFACKCNTITNRSFGRNESRLVEYAWVQSNSENRKLPHTVCRLKPNEFGLFDMLGNVGERCLGKFVEESGEETMSRYIAMGGAFNSLLDDVESGRRSSLLPSEYTKWHGFRLARTYPIQDADE